MKAHPASEIFPLLSNRDLDDLTKDIEEHGLLDPIVMIGDEILDGRNRALACERLGTEPETREWDGRPNGSPTTYVVSVNLHRRQLTPSQKAMAAAKASPLFTAEAKQRQGHRADRPNIPPISAGSSGDARDQASEAVGGVNHAYFNIAMTLLKNHPDLADEVARGEKSITAAARKIGREEATGGSARRRARKEVATDQRAQKLNELLTPLDRYLEQWDEQHIAGITRKNATKLLAKVQRVNRHLTEVSIAIEARTVQSRALK